MIEVIYPEKNEEAAEVYIIDPSNNEVDVEGLGKDLTEEELEAMEDMSAEEIDDFLVLDEVEEPIHEINSILKDSFL